MFNLLALTLAGDELCFNGSHQRLTDPQICNLKITTPSFFKVLFFTILLFSQERCSLCSFQITFAVENTCFFSYSCNGLVHDVLFHNNSFYLWVVLVAKFHFLENKRTLEMALERLWFQGDVQTFL